MRASSRGRFERVARALVVLFGAALALALMPAAGDAMTIERLLTPGGLEAWLVRDKAVPLIALEFAIRGAADQDPADKPGVANMAVSLLDEGAGPFDATAFHDRLDRKAIELSFRAGHDYLRGTLRTLTENRDEAFDYLRLALTEPRFDPAAVERIRAQLLSRLNRESTSPNGLAGRNWWASAFPDHPYGRPVEGTPDSLPRITVDDLKSEMGRVLARENLTLAVVGDLEATTAAELIDRTFGVLPAKANLAPMAEVVAQGLGRRLVIPLDVPQAVVNFGAPGISRSDPDFMAAYLVNHILGGGSFSSRLYSEVREKRGLAYGISETLLWLDHSAVLFGGTATRADATAESIAIIEREVQRMAELGPTGEELSEAKSYLKGSFALGLDTSSRIASQLVQMQLDHLGIDYIERRAALIDAVSLADAKRVARRLLGNGLLVTVAGRPAGVSSTENSTAVGASPTAPAKPTMIPAGSPEPRH